LKEAHCQAVCRSELLVRPDEQANEVKLLESFAEVELEFCFREDINGERLGE